MAHHGNTNGQRTSSANSMSRRTFISRTGAVASAVLAGVNAAGVHAAEDNTIRLALVGCGGRGSGAVGDAMSSSAGPVKLVAMADVFEDRITRSYKALSDQFGARVDVPPERRFVGFDAWQKALDCLGAGGVMIQATHAAFRPLHVGRAVDMGINVFMEKSFAPDPGGTRDIMAIGRKAQEKNLKIGCGLMCRHSASRQALIDKIRQGAIGEPLTIRACRMDPGARLGPFKGGESEVLWQLRRPYFFLWTSSAWFIEMMIHQVDECCWIKGAWPVAAHGLGGREPDSSDRSQNLHTYSIEYIFADGSRAIVNSRSMQKCHDEFTTFIHGTKCAAQFSGNVHAPTVHIFNDQRCERNNIAWSPPRERLSPYVAEWDALLGAIRNDTRHNETERAAYANLASIMGRAATHSQRIITWDEMLASDFRFCADVAALTADTPAPVRADANGRYPVPTPGTWKEI